MSSLWSNYVVFIFIIVLLSVVAQEDEEEKVSNRIPQFITQSQTIYARKGDKIVLECMVDNLHPFTSMWMKGKDILTLGEKVMKNPNNPDVALVGTSLVIPSFDEKAAGQYSCVISSTPKQTLTHEVRLPVPAKIVETSPKSGDVTVIEGDRVVLNCILTGTPPLTVHWTHEGSSITSTINSVLSEDGKSLTFKSVQHSDGGQYMCVAKNQEGEDKATFRIKVKTAPKIIIEKKLTPSGGRRVTLELSCHVISEPPVEIIWNHSGRNITSNDTMGRYRLRSSPSYVLTLSVIDIQENDFGNFSCITYNDVGSTWEIIDVSGLPSEVEILSSLVGDLKNQYHLKFRAQSAKDILTYKLMLRKVMPPGEDGPDVWSEVTIPSKPHTPPDSTQSYLIEGLQPASKYEFHIVASNEHGWSNVSKVFQFSTAGASMSSDGAHLGVSDVAGDKETHAAATQTTGSHATVTQITGTQSGLKNEPSTASSSQVPQRAKIIAIMTVVILVAFF